MIQQESVLKVADNTELEKFYVFVLWEVQVAAMLQWVISLRLR